MSAIKGITVAIDGPAGAGKSTVAKEVAGILRYALVDTGAIYRAVALIAQRRGVALDDDTGLDPIVKNLSIEFDLRDATNHVYVEGENITDAIRTLEIAKGAAVVSLRPMVRRGLLNLQRHLAGQGGAVLEGRDIGTVVCPLAPVKIFLDASAEERARRRHEELTARGDRIDFADVLRDLRARDTLDRQRPVAPLVPAADAILLDSTQMPVDKVINTIVDLARAAEQTARQKDLKGGHLS